MQGDVLVLQLCGMPGDLPYWHLQVLEVLIATLFGSAPLSAAADEAFLSLAALAASARDVPQAGAQRCGVLIRAEYSCTNLPCHVVPRSRSTYSRPLFKSKICA